MMEIKELLAQFHFKRFRDMKKHDAMRMLQALKLYKPIYDSVPFIPKVKPGPLGSRIIPTQKVVVEDTEVVAPVAPRKRVVDNKKKKERVYVANYAENDGIVSFKE